MAKLAPRDFTIVASSPEMTEELGRRLGCALQAGDVLALIGELGAGKTTLVRGVAAGLGMDPDVVKSPTFVLLREYSPAPSATRLGGAGRPSLIHIDGYRFDNAQAVVWEDVDWVFSPKKVTVIEWADRIGESLPEAYLEIRLAHTSAKRRTLTLVPHGPRAQQLVESLQTPASH